MHRHTLPWPVLSNGVFVAPWHQISQPCCPGNFLPSQLLHQWRKSVWCQHPYIKESASGSHKTWRNFPPPSVCQPLAEPAESNCQATHFCVLYTPKHRCVTGGRLLKPFSLVFSGALMAQGKSQGFNQDILFQKGSWMPHYQRDCSAI